MGQLFAAPVTSKESEDGACEEKGLSWGVSCMQGWRMAMEDAHLAVGSLGASPGWADIALFGVMDGHGGDEVARFVQKYLIQQVQKHPVADLGEASLVKAFHGIDELLFDPGRLDELQSCAGGASGLGRSSNSRSICHPDHVGCTCVVCCVAIDCIICANSGDSRAVLCRGGKAIDLSEDHKPNSPGERKRIENAGGFVAKQAGVEGAQWRVNGNLNLSRAIGDLEFKRNTALPPEDQIICSTPDVQTVTRGNNDEFMIIACDGVWDMMSSQDVVDFVRKRLLASKASFGGALPGKQLSLIMEELLDTCLSPDLNLTAGLGGDNMTAIVVVFDKPRAPLVQVDCWPARRQDLHDLPYAREDLEEFPVTHMVPLVRMDGAEGSAKAAWPCMC